MQRAFFLLAACVLSAARSQAAEPLVLADGDRVVLLGNTLIEREQRYGYWEALLTSRHPDRNVTFRNLGWSGDTVFGHARAGFGSVADGFRNLKDHVLSLKPTVILVGYGTNESFDGEAGLPRFRQGLSTLLDLLAQTKAQIVLLSPLEQEDLGRPWPDPAEQNRNLRLYRDAIRHTAEERSLRFVDLFDPPLGAQLTDNGIHLTAYGYWQMAAILGRGLGIPARQPIERDASRSTRLEVVDEFLPLAAPADRGQGPFNKDSDRVLQFTGLAEGRHTLRIDGEPILTATAAQWSKGVTLRRGPEFDQAERLRLAIVEKNHQYFHRWRPQNETYLFGFRKHEQGRNAAEVPLFDPLVAKLEEEIAKLRKPARHTCEILPQRENE